MGESKWNVELKIDSKTFEKLRILHASHKWNIKFKGIEIIINAGSPDDEPPFIAQNVRVWVRDSTIADKPPKEMQEAKYV